MKGFQTFSEWRHALTVRCGIHLTPEYARERIAALENPKDRHTAEFVKCYGDSYRLQVIAWFEQATAENAQ